MRIETTKDGSSDHFLVIFEGDVLFGYWVDVAFAEAQVDEVDCWVVYYK